MWSLLAGLAFGCSQQATQEKPSKKQTAALYTTNAGTDYIDECRNAGVPVPDFVLDSSWVNHGTIADPFISETGIGGPLNSELWSWTSASPRGICLALPRWITTGFDKDRAQLYGVICQGQDSSRACFFDNPQGKFFDKKPHKITEFVGGADLVANGQGICTDCHAGANPFVIHPEKAPFSDLTSDRARRDALRPASGWHIPIAPAGTASRPWPLNPGPTTRLSGIQSMRSCAECHLLPEISTNLKGYCNAILKTSTTRSSETMPPSAGVPPGRTYSEYRDYFTNHTAALSRFCGEEPPDLGGVVVEATGKDNPSLISKPIVQSPLYECAEGLTVRGVIADAEVDLEIDGTVVDTQKAEGSVVAFYLQKPLISNSKVTATQRINSASSPRADLVTVVPYPDSTLPTPTIDPDTTYECAKAIAVRTVPGATLEAVQNGVTRNAQRTVSGYQSLTFGRTPWVTGDTFVVRASLCGKVSKWSDPLTASPAPLTLRTPRFVPSTIYEGQTHFYMTEKDFGAFEHIELGATRLGDTCGSPTSTGCSFNVVTSALSRPLKVGDVLSATPSLYCGSATSIPIKTPPAQPCADLPAPRIAAPYVGESSVAVLEALPDARIRLYDSANAEIADGAGDVLFLHPPRTFLAGERVVAVQSVGGCTAVRGFAIGTRIPNPQKD